MTYKDRLPIYREIERLRERPLIVYATRNANINGGMMSLDSIPEFCEQLVNIPDTSKKVDLLIASQGGDAIAAWRIINLLREQFEEVDVLVPYIAQSAATILVLGADHIIMHPFSCLGPIDPQITIPGDSIQQPPKSFSVEDVRAYIEFVENDLYKVERVDYDKFDSSSSDVGSRTLDHLVTELKPTQIGLVKKSIKLSETLADRLLSQHMSDNEKIEEISKQFNSFTHHGYTIGRGEALDYGLPVIYPSKELADLMWRAWCDLSNEMRCEVPFDPMALITSDPSLNETMDNGIKSGTTYAMSFKDTTNVSFVESVRLTSHFEVDTHIMASGNGINISFNVINSAKGWVRSHGD